LEDLQRGALVEGDSHASSFQLPPWLDMSRCLRVNRFWEEHAVPLALSWHCALVIGFSLPSLLGAIVFTGKSDTPEKSLIRYIGTAAHLAEWHMGNIWDPASTAFRSLQQVRNIHATVRQDMDQKLPPQQQKHISQYDMAVVQVGFMGPFALFAGKFGVHASQQQLDDYGYFWRCVGYQLGISDEFNVCSLGNPATESIIKEIIDKVLLPDIHNPPPQYSQIADAYIDGINLCCLGVPVMSVASTLAFTYWGLGAPRPRMGFPDQCRYMMLRMMVLMIGLMPPYRRFLGRSFTSTLTRLGSGRIEAHPKCAPLAVAMVGPPLLLAVVMLLALTFLAFVLLDLWESRQAHHRHHHHHYMQGQAQQVIKNISDVVIALAV
jgi:hypothetical protein